MILAEMMQNGQLSTGTAEALLTVDVESLSVRVSTTGQCYPLGSIKVARWLWVLADRPSTWVSTAELAQIDPDLSGQRVERLRKQLHRSIAKLVEVKRGKGARLVVR